MIKTAVIMVGGKGPRMGKLTKALPKCLLKVGDFSIISHLVTQLRMTNINKIILCTGYLNKKIKEYCNDKIFNDSDKILIRLKIPLKKFKFPELVFCVSGSTDSTSNRLLLAKKKIDDEFFLYLYGDTLLKPNIKSMIRSLKKKKLSGVITISNPPSKFGIIKTKKNIITSFEEKKIINNVWVNSGWIILKKKILNKLKKSSQNFENYLFKEEIRKKKMGYYKNKGIYLPIDRVNDLENARMIFKNKSKAWY